MKKRTFLITLLFSIAIACLSGCSFIGISVTFDDIELEVGNKVQLASDVIIGGKSVPIEYSFSGSAISIEGGMLTALVAETDTTVTASATGMKTAEFKVSITRSSNVTVVKDTTVKMNFNDMTLTVGDSAALVSSVTVSGVSKALTYSLVGNCVSLENNMLTAVEAGVATVKVTADKFEASFTVTVIEKANTDVEATLNDMTLTQGDSITLARTVNIGGEDKTLTYSSSGTGITLNGYNLTATAVSSANVVYARADGFEGSFTVTVVSEVVDGNGGVTQINIGLSDLSLEVGDTAMLLEAITIDGERSSLEYTFSGSAISIENGVLTALKLGTVTTVTATAGDYVTAFKVTVGSDVGTMTIDAPSKIYTNYPGKEITVKFSKEAFASDVTYTTDNEQVKVVDGKIVATGTFDSNTVVNVTASSEYHTSTFTVTVSTFTKNSSETKVSWYEENIINDPKNQGATIFVGDSYFDGYMGGSNVLPSYWSDFYTDYANEEDIFLMGISSAVIDVLETVSERIVYPINPSEIVIHIGFNDLHHSDISGEDFAAKLIALVEQYKERLPGVEIYFCSIEPKKNGLSEGSAYYASSTVKAPAANALIKAYADENDWFHYIDTQALCYKSDGTIDQSFYLSTDYSHPTLASYDSYRKLINAARGVENIEDKESEENEEVENTDPTYTEINNNAGATIQTVAKYYTDGNGNALTTNYTVSGFMDISNIASGTAPHIQFRFSNTTADRFLLYDSDKNQKFGVCAPFAGISNESSDGALVDYIDATSGSVTIKWKVVVDGTTAYLYINDRLTLSGNPTTFEYFNVSVQFADIAIYGVEVITAS